MSATQLSNVAKSYSSNSQNYRNIPQTKTSKSTNADSQSHPERSHCLVTSPGQDSNGHSRQRFKPGITVGRSPGALPSGRCPCSATDSLPGPRATPARQSHHPAVGGTPVTGGHRDQGHPGVRGITGVIEISQGSGVLPGNTGRSPDLYT